LGTTISPYLFFWQSSLETEEIETRPREQPLKEAPRQSAEQFERIRLDTWVGIGAAAVVSFFIIVAAAATLNAHGLKDVDTLQQAARALQPIAGKVGMVLFAVGVIGTGLLAVPALSGSAAYAVGEALGLPTGMHRKPARAKGFYAVLAIATAVGLIMSFPTVEHATHLSPVKALFWASVLNGIAAAPIMVMVMLMARSRKVLGESLRLSPWHQTIGWIATAIMALATVMIFIE
ncbi:MAG TPA: divalent metal cation transporter, partial [Tepidisphaeraceae bacterium]|nr:divalent metal cation transporter [Tepidisphaeraceae bacterium]